MNTTLWTLIVDRICVSGKHDLSRMRMMAIAMLGYAISLILVFGSPHAGGGELSIVHGRVWAISGEPLSGVDVRLFDGKKLVASSKSDKNGEYRLTFTCKLAVCDVVLRVWGQGHLFETNSYHLKVPPLEAIRKDFREIAGGFVSGRVTRVNGSPAAALPVSARDIQSGKLLDFRATDDEGRFGFYLPEGPARILPESGPDGLQFAALDVVVSATAIVTNVDFVAQSSTRLAGSIRKADGTYWPDHLVVTLLAKSSANRLAVVTHDVIPAGEGAFTFSGIAPGDYEIRFMAAGRGLLLRTNIVVSLGQVVTNMIFIISDDQRPGPSVSEIKKLIDTLGIRPKDQEAE